MKVLVAQSCLTLCDPMDCIPPGSSVHGILQARILEWVAIPFSRASSQPRDRTWCPALQADSLLSEPPGKPSYRLHKRQMPFSAFEKAPSETTSFAAQMGSRNGKVTIDLGSGVPVSHRCPNTLQTQGSKPQKFTPHSLEARVQLWCHWAEIKMLAGPQPLLEAVGEDSFDASSFCWQSRSLCLWPHCSNLCLYLHITFSSSVCIISSCLSLIRRPVICFVCVY